MALKRTERKVGAPRATIGVNRGGGNRELASTMLSSNTTSAINDWLKTKTLALKEAEQAKGKQLGKAATLVYEDVTDADGNTFQVASSYETPDNMINSSWSAHTFTEEATDRLVSGMLVGAKQIIESEKNKMRSNMNLDHSVAQITNAFRNNVNQTLDVFRNNVPSELQEYFNLKSSEMITNEESVLANRHMTLTTTFRNAEALRKTNNLGSLLTTLSYADPVQANILLDEHKKYLSMLTAKGIPQAKTELETRIKSFEVINKLGKNLSNYTTSDYSVENNQEVNIFAKNLSQLQIMFNEGPGSVVTLTNVKTGEQEEVSFESLGVAPNEYMIHNDELRKSFSRLETYLQNKFTDSVKDQELNILTNLSLKNNKTAFTEKKQIKHAAQQLMNLESNFSQRMIAEYNAANKDGNITSGNLNDNPARALAFYQWVASTTGVVRDDLRLELEQMLLNNSMDKSHISRILSNPMWNTITGAELILNKDTSKVTDLISTIGLSQEAQTRAMSLRNSITLYGPEAGVTDYIQQRQRNEGKSYTVKEVAIEAGYTSAIELETEIQKTVKNNFSNYFLADPFLSYKFLTDVTDSVIRHMTGNPELAKGDARTKLINDALMQVEKTMNYGYSQYTLGVDVISSGGDAIDLAGDMQSFTQYPPEPYLQHQKQRDLIQSKLDSVNSVHLENRARGYYSTADELVLGKNVHLQLIGNPYNSDQAVYRFVFSENDGTRQQMLVNDDLEVITVSVGELQQALFEGY